MKHIQTIYALIKTLLNSGSFHALVVQSPPGWGKSTTVNQAIQELGISAMAAGSYATPLHIYNTLARHPNATIIFDDCAGVFTDTKAMSILKAATWESSGTAPANGRRVTWGSTSDKVEVPFVDFSGKLILLTNSLAAGRETEAFLSRCLSYRIGLDDDEVRKMLLDAAESKAHFAKTETARTIAVYLTNGEAGVDLRKVSLRTLKMGYELAETHPESWRDLFTNLLPRKQAEEDVVAQILRSGLSSREQELKFIATTGKSRRTFYLYKKRLGLTRSYQGGKQ